MNSLLHRRWFRTLAWTLVSLISLYALLCAWVNWTGARMLAAAQAKLKAAGEVTDFRSVTSEPVPDDSNYCAIPALRDLALHVGDNASKDEPGARRERLKKMALPTGGKSRPRSGRGAQFGVREDLDGIRDWLRSAGTIGGSSSGADAAHEILDALSVHQALIGELAAGLDRSSAQWTPQWRTRELPPMLFAVVMPHYSVSQSVVQTLALRATAAARAGDATKAHESLRIIGKLALANGNDPFLIGLLVSAANATALANAVWETCDARCGKAADFATLESALTALDYKKAALHAWRGEMAGGMEAMNYVKTTNDGTLASIIANGGDASPSHVANAITSVLPGGWLDGNAAVIADREYDYFLKPLKEAGWMRVIESAEAFEAKLREEKKVIWRHPFHLMTAMLAPAGVKVTQQVAYTQCLIDQASIACALERHRIENGAYPETLAGLTLANGQPLPLDPLSEKPMSYRKTADGRYALWGVGFDGKDDGGKRVLDEKMQQDTKFNERTYNGDWVWDFAGTK